MYLFALISIDVYSVRLEEDVIYTFKKPNGILVLLSFWQLFEISPSLYVVELRKSYGDASVYREV